MFMGTLERLRFWDYLILFEGIKRQPDRECRLEPK